MSGYINNNNSNSNNSNSNYNSSNQSSSLPQQPGLYGIVTSTIGITEYIAFFIINKITTILGIDTSGKGLNSLLDEIYKVLEDPVTRQKFLLVMGSIAEILVVLVDELSGPLKEATLQFIDLGHEATVKLAKSLIAASIDALGTLPVAGEIIEGVKLFDDIAKQIQSSINVFLKTFTLLTNLLGANLDRVDNIRTRIEGSVDKIKSQLQGLNINIPTLPGLPSLDNLQNNITSGISNLQSNLQSNLNNGISNLQGNLQGKINTGIANAIPNAIPNAYTPPQPVYPQKGGMKNININVNKTAKKIVKNLQMFYNRKYKPNTTRRNRKQ
jgi:hypothetical protein